ncbi:TPA: DUF417 family protein [Morganella morganii]
MNKKGNNKTRLHKIGRQLEGADMIVLRLSVIVIFALFGTYKWFDFEAAALYQLLQKTWLGELYPILGIRGLSYVLGATEYVTLFALIIGFIRPSFGAAGAFMVIATGLVTLSLLPQLGRIDSFIIKDILLIGIGTVLLRYDLMRT